MKLLYDLYCTQPSKSAVHGGGVYGQTLFAALVDSPKIKSGEVKVSVLLHPDKPLPDGVTELIRSNGIEVLPCRSSKDILLHLDGDAFDRFYSPLPNYLMNVLSRKTKVPFFATLHDIRELDIRYDWFFRQYQPNPIKRFRLFLLSFFEKMRLKKVKTEVGKFLAFLEGMIFTDSLHSKYRLLTEFPALENGKVGVFYPLEKIPGKFSPEEKKEILHKYSLEEKKYFLLLACNRPGKNALRVVAAVDEYKVFDGTGYKLLCIGFTAEQRDHVKRLFPAGCERCVFIPYVSENELTVLYAGAFCFLFPSISEGFGYPPLEAMRQGVPVIATSVTSVPEICGASVLYANPYSVKELSYRILEIMNEAGTREACIKKGYQKVSEIDSVREKDKDRLIQEILR